MASETQTNLTVAVTGVTGTLGLGLMPLLEADDRVAHVTGVARHPFDPASARLDEDEVPSAATSATLSCCVRRFVMLTSWCTWRSR